MGGRGEIWKGIGGDGWFRGSVVVIMWAEFVPVLLAVWTTLLLTSLLGVSLLLLPRRRRTGSTR